MTTYIVIFHLLFVWRRYRNLREKHKRYVEEVSGKTGPAPQAKIQSSSGPNLAGAEKEARCLLEQGEITEEEFDAIMHAHDTAGQKEMSRGGGGGQPKVPRRSSSTLTKQERLLGRETSDGGGSSEGDDGVIVIEL